MYKTLVYTLVNGTI